MSDKLKPSDYEKADPKIGEQFGSFTELPQGEPHEPASPTKESK